MGALRDNIWGIARACATGVAKKSLRGERNKAGQRAVLLANRSAHPKPQPLEIRFPSELEGQGGEAANDILVIVVNVVIFVAAVEDAIENTCGIIQAAFKELAVQLSAHFS